MCKDLAPEQVLLRCARIMQDKAWTVAIVKWTLPVGALFSSSSFSLLIECHTYVI